MKATSIITTLRTRVAMTLLLVALLIIPQETQATEFITDVMLIGGTQSHVNDNFITANADVNNDKSITVTDVMVLVNNILNGKSTFKVVTNIDDLPIIFGGGGTNPARVSQNRPTQ